MLFMLMLFMSAREKPGRKENANKQVNASPVGSQEVEL